MVKKTILEYNSEIMEIILGKDMRVMRAVLLEQFRVTRVTQLTLDQMPAFIDALKWSYGITKKPPSTKSKDGS